MSLRFWFTGHVKTDVKKSWTKEIQIYPKTTWKVQKINVRRIISVQSNPVITN